MSNQATSETTSLPTAENIEATNIDQLQNHDPQTDDAKAPGMGAILIEGA